MSVEVAVEIDGKLKKEESDKKIYVTLQDIIDYIFFYILFFVLFTIVKDVAIWSFKLDEITKCTIVLVDWVYKICLNGFASGFFLYSMLTTNKMEDFDFYCRRLIKALVFYFISPFFYLLLLYIGPILEFFAAPSKIIVYKSP